MTLMQVNERVRFEYSKFADEKESFVRIYVNRMKKGKRTEMEMPH